MAGDVEEPFRISFQADSLHSGSISFGRFEVESLSWERRSSFSHNRYLEEVKKYARAGSVTEKKAYFEAHFRKKALLRQASSEGQVENEGSVNESGSCETDNCDENISGTWSPTEKLDQRNDKNDDYHLDKSPKSSSYDGDSKGEISFIGPEHLESRTEHASSILKTDGLSNPIEKDYVEDDEFQEECMGISHPGTNVELASDSADTVENVDKSCESMQTFRAQYEHEYVLTSNDEHDIEVGSKSNDPAPGVVEDHSSHCHKDMGFGLGKLPSHVPKLTTADKSRSAGIRSRFQGEVPATRKAEVKKGNSLISDWREKQTPSRMKTQKEMSKSIRSSSQSSVRNTKQQTPPSFKTKAHWGNGSEKELRSKRGSILQPSTPERTESRTNLCEVRKKYVPPTNKEANRWMMNSRYKFCEGGDKRRHLSDQETEITRIGVSLNSKPMPKTSTCQDTVPRGSSRHKPRVIPGSVSSSRVPTKCFHFGDKRAAVSKPYSETIVSPSIYEGSNVNLGRAKCEQNKTIGARNHVRKEVVHKKEESESDGKKQQLTECRPVQERTINARKKEDIGRNGNAILGKNKSVGHGSVMSHLTVRVAS